MTPPKHREFYGTALTLVGLRVWTPILLVLQWPQRLLHFHGLHLTLRGVRYELALRLRAHAPDDRSGARSDTQSDPAGRDGRDGGGATNHTGNRRLLS
eukprot:COSAG02_NODE_6274_length_3687_cov_1.680602_4_plen_97_part_01